jgi:hypothetical protein
MYVCISICIYVFIYIHVYLYMDVTVNTEIFVVFDAYNPAIGALEG